MAKARIAWTPSLVEWLRSVFSDTPNKDIAQAVPGLTLVALATKASDLGLRKSREYRLRYLGINRAEAIKALTGASPWNKVDHVSINCETCGNVFQVQPCRAKTAHYCSYPCLNEWKKTISGEKNWNFKVKPVRTCEWCAKEFECKPAKVTYGEGRFCSRSCLGSYSIRSQGGRRSGLETLVESELVRIGAEFIPSAKIGRWNVDFYLPLTRMVVECDGSYWHNIPKVKERDARKTASLLREGYKVARLTEDQIRLNLVASVAQLFT